MGVLDDDDVIKQVLDQLIARTQEARLNSDAPREVLIATHKDVILEVYPDRAQIAYLLAALVHRTCELLET
jgi:hypothetical protein